MAAGHVPRQPVRLLWRGTAAAMIDYSKLRFGKGTPRVILKMAKATLKAQTERACRKLVDQRDGRKCFFPKCRAYAGSKHHIVASSVRGSRIWRTDDIVSACETHHRLFKAGLIRTTGNPDIKHDLRVHVTPLGRAHGITVPKVA